MEEMQVEQKIKEFLGAKGISQAHLSRESGIPFVKLNLSLNGKRRMSLEEYRSVCWALDVPADTFLAPAPPEQQNGV